MIYLDENMEPKVKKIITHIILGIVGLTLVFGSWGVVFPGERGVRIRLGEIIGGVVGEGLYFKIPLIERVVKMNVQTVKHEVDAVAYSKDIQTVDSRIALNYHLNPDFVQNTYREVRREYEARIIDPAIQESVKAATALFTAQELIERRPKVKDEIKVHLSERLAGKYIIVEEFSIVNFDFSDSYESAIEAKQVAQQNALKAENDLIRIKVEAEQRVAQATAEAEAIRIQAQAITQQGGEDYVQLKAIEKWSGLLPTQMIPGGTVPFLNLTK